MEGSPEDPQGISLECDTGIKGEGSESLGGEQMPPKMEKRERDEEKRF